jgi:hypothetical protein
MVHVQKNSNTALYGMPGKRSRMELHKRAFWERREFLRSCHGLSLISEVDI